MQTKINEDKLVQMVNWLVNHPKVQYRLCDDESEVSPEEFIETMELFERNGFYEWIPVLFLKNCYNDVLHQAMTSLLIEKAGQEWQRTGTEQLCKDIKDKIKEEIRLKEERRSTF